jgi:hypothetical protein
MKRASIYIFTILLTFSVGSACPALWEFSVIVANDAWAELRRAWKPATFKCVYLEPHKEPELIDLAAPLPPAPPEPLPRRKAQSNNGMHPTADTTAVK